MQVDSIIEGVFPKTSTEAIVTENTKEMLNLELGEEIVIHTPQGSDLTYTISGFMRSSPKIMREDSYGIFLTTESFRSFRLGAKAGEPADYNRLLLIKFMKSAEIQDSITQIKSQFGLPEKQVMENTTLLGLMGESGDLFMLQIYGTAGVLFVLVMLAGILMIASSLNSNIAERTQFFGMIRCIGATPKQTMALVHKEALGWCKFAIPSGVAAGVVVIWFLCFLLRYLSPAYFGAMPKFDVSLPSIAAGVFIGILTVLLAARSPAKRASKVSPLAAVSGHANNLQPVKKAANTRVFRVDTALGIHHAKSSKKNFILMVGSFSLSIVLFLSFSVTVDFMKYAVTPIQPWSPDISIISADSTCSIDKEILEELRENPVVKKAYGSMFANNIPISHGEQVEAVDLVSYEEHQLEWAQKYLIDGSLESIQKESSSGLIVYDTENTVQVGDVVTLDYHGQSEKITIVGMLSDAPFDNKAGDLGTIICSEDTFTQLTKQRDYTVIDVQLTKKATDANVNAIHKAVGTKHTFSDSRLGNRSAVGTFYSFGLFIYGFLCVIALITIFNIVNSIAMSVSARMKQYGAFRAIGLSDGQLTRMIVAEACTYAVVGFICGGALGIMLNKILFQKMVTFHWGVAWSVPLVELGLVMVIIVVSVILAVRGPVKRIKKMSIVDTISAQ